MIILIWVDGLRSITKYNYKYKFPKNVCSQIVKVASLKISALRTKLQKKNKLSPAWNNRRLSFDHLTLKFLNLHFTFTFFYFQNMDLFERSIRIENIWHDQTFEWKNLNITFESLSELTFEC